MQGQVQGSVQSQDAGEDLFINDGPECSVTPSKGKAVSLGINTSYQYS